MSDHLDKLRKYIEFFNEHREEFLKEHHQQFVVIFDSQVIGFFDSEQAAYAAGKSEYGNSTFLLRQCLTLDEEKSKRPVFHSRVA